ncbi:hypothetical protein NDU88_009541 [Pleurodeles waltl]|uniref:Uncharacterized protein n=1 Tax=Pleurodeles waltl TaxID=8319 RepID=A0AAV7RVI2_PLEWA|nr:hypothetical protein NDU88_009541 [Pleurodeles waltl]
MDHYALLAPVSQHTSRHASGQGGKNEQIGEPSRAGLLQAIQGAQQVLESKIKTVAIEVNLLRTDFRKVSDKICVAEGSMRHLQAEVATLKKQVAATEANSGTLEAGVEDLGGDGTEYAVGALSAGNCLVHGQQRTCF